MPNGFIDTRCELAKVAITYDAETPRCNPLLGAIWLQSSDTAVSAAPVPGEADRPPVSCSDFGIAKVRIIAPRWTNPIGSQEAIGVAMEHSEKVAHHEAAHAVIAVLCGAGLSDHGIDLNAPTSSPGAFGNAGAMLFDHDATLPKDEQQRLLLGNLMTICAGSASDAKISGIELSEALARQPGDKQKALQQLQSTPLIDQDGDGADVERDFLLEHVLDRLTKMLAKSEVWTIIQDVANAALLRGGVLSKADVQEIVADTRPAD
jgi:hypothetical protein